MAYLYAHIRLDKNEVFYIGIGNDSDGKYYRANSIKSRNTIWHNIIKKSDYKVEIIFDNFTWDQAKEKEKELIAFYGRKDKGTGVLCNLTDGGDGSFGLIVSEEIRKKKSEFFKGRLFSEETRKKISKALTGRKVSEDVVKKRSKSNTGKKRTEETKLKMSQRMKGNKYTLGRILSEDHKQKLSKAHKGLQSGSKHPAAKKVININTNEEYGCLKEMCEATGLSFSTMRKRLKGWLKNSTPWRFA
jgi:hypothetical protein